MLVVVAVGGGGEVVAVGVGKVVVVVVSRYRRGARSGSTMKGSSAAR